MSQEMLGRLPTPKIFFIVISGLFVALVLPIDLLRIFTIPFNSSDFQVFANAKYVASGDLQKSAIIIFVALLIGVLINLFYGELEKPNHIPKYLWNREWKEAWKAEHAEPEHNFYKKEDINFSKFAKWITVNGLATTLDFMNTMVETSVAFLYGSEIVLSITVILFPIFYFWQNPVWRITVSNGTWTTALGVEITLVILAMSAYLSYKKKNKIDAGFVVDLFKEFEKLPPEEQKELLKS